MRRILRPLTAAATLGFLEAAISVALAVLAGYSMVDLGFYIFG